MVTGPERIRIVIIDGYEGVRLGLRIALAVMGDLAVIGMAATGSEAERLCAQVLPDIVLMDTHLPGTDGIGIIQRVRRRFPRTGVIVLTNDASAETRRRAEAAGAVHYLPKYVDVARIAHVIRAVHHARRGQAHSGCTGDTRFLTRSVDDGKDARMMNDTMTETLFSREVDGLPHAVATLVVDLADGARYTITAMFVRKRIGDAEARMLAYNGAIPSPTLRVRQGSTVTIDFANEIDLESTIHWHGLRLDNRFDGTHETQQPVPVGGTFTCRVHFPAPGVYWYHPHIREDYGQGGIVPSVGLPHFWEYS